jgi:lipopolysaccharide/colanic/teichoic acid biosynthesis glycosyltransferase
LELHIWLRLIISITNGCKRKFEQDIYYVDRLGFTLDIKIFLKAIKKVKIREGVDQADLLLIKYF